jgi:Nitroreductase
MDLTEAIFGRRSTRDYTAEAVDEPTIRRLIDAAIHAPNASNGQPWTFTVVRDQGLLDRISDAAKSHMLATLPDGLSPTVTGRCSAMRASRSSITPRR